jgi:spore germination protein KA
MDTTERPDVCAAALVEGRFAIFVDGSPFVIIAPTTFPYLFSAAEDYYNKYYFTSFIRFISYLAFLVTLSGPSIYIAVTTYHPEMFPATLLISVQGARANVPFPAFLEAVLIELMFEVIREVAVRLPSRISQALSIIGALVIGEISVQAGLVSPLMMIIVAVTGLASFIIPKLNSARQISVLRFPMMLFAATMGIFGLIMAGLVILIHLVSLRSFGVPYLSPITPLNPEGLKDTVIILPPWMMKKKYSYMNSDAGESSSNEAQYKNQNK